jgi:hypothetical protein
MKIKSIFNQNFFVGMLFYTCCFLIGYNGKNIALSIAACCLLGILFSYANQSKY